MNKIITNQKTKINSLSVKRFLATAVLALGLTVNANAQMFCQAAFTYTAGAGGHVDFTNTSTGTTPSTGYHWYFGDNTQASTQNTSHDYTYNGIYHVDMMIDSSSGGCSSIASDSIVISNGINCTLNPSFTYTAGTSGMYSFASTSTGVDPGMIFTWTWQGANGYGSASGQNATATFAYNGTYNLTMTVGDPTQTCYKNTTQVITVTNSQACVVDFTYALGANGLVTFTNASVGNSSYYWGFGDGNSSTVTSPTHTYYNGTYHVNMWADTSGGACGGSRDTTITITNGATAPTCNASFTYTLSPGGRADFTNTSTTTLSNPMYSWNFGDGHTSLSSPTANDSFAYNGSYNVILTIKDTLGNIVCSSNQLVTITSAAGGCHDSAYFYMVRDTFALSTWNIYLASNTANYPSNAVWNWGDGTTSTGLYPSHMYATAGWYTICVKAYYACGDSSYYCENDSVYRSNSSMVNMHVYNAVTGQTAIKNVTNNIAGVKLYPNPFSDNLTLNLNASTGTAYTYTMSDMYGNQIISEKVLADKGENKIQLNTSNINSGVYFVTIMDNTTKKAQTIKVVK
jgi:PKD repeat protein